MLQRNDDVEFVRTHQKRGFMRRLKASFRVPGKAMSVILSWQAIRLDRNILMKLSDEHLKDIGLSRSMIDHVAASRPRRGGRDGRE